MRFMLWWFCAPSVIVVSGKFPMLCMGCPRRLLVGLTSMVDAVGPCLSSTTSIGSMGASKGEGITSTLMNSSSYLVSCLASVASHGARLLRVFLPAWLGAPIFGGSIVGTGWFMLTKSSMVIPVLCVNSLPLCVLYFSATSRFHNGSYVACVSPLYRQVMKLLGEVSPNFINVMVLCNFSLN
jgi:hypothetical protein